ncbi:hypothetical protein J0871_16765 [Salegentibacter sp. BDJ18]|uniref:hypothetical protein n=1 Tax=Salegentibacter sp. BDJ18 TaxID=2816376 RepID=UPI001AAEA94D|nr:hypothetical protein [Salegentibacter sp. BDJ18]MBO2546071.1 hypothetical protein [Salegentibacter sp. BDJ18]
MTLSFSKYWPDDMPSHMANYRTNFVEKIWTSLDEELLFSFYREKYQVDFANRELVDKLLKERADYDINWTLYDHLRLSNVFKAHTIRGDYHDRWKPGNDIHFYINVRKPNQFLFAPVMKCTAVQSIDFTHFHDHIEVELSDNFWKARGSVKGKIYEWDIQLQILAQNDGFDTVEDFFSWFNETTATGSKLIHWTKYTY